MVLVLESVSVVPVLVNLCVLRSFWLYSQRTDSEVVLSLMSEMIVLASCYVELVLASLCVLVQA